MSTFKQAALHVLMRTINKDQKEVANLRKVFEQMACLGNGMICAEELCSYLVEHQCYVSENEVQTVIKDT